MSHGTNNKIDYTFPFNTCEKKREIIAQPYSVFVNLINCVIILYFLLKTTKFHTFLFIFIILCFELFHVFSHSLHIEGNIQVNITHTLSYAINFALLYTLYKRTNILPSTLFIIYYIFLIITDIYVFNNYNVVLQIFTQALLFLSVIAYFYNTFSNKIKNNMFYIFICVFIIIGLFINEKINCKYMMEKYPNFPFHAIIEVVAIMFFYLLCKSFYN